MIECCFHCADDGRITGFSISGHAGRGKKGSDPVCAAVSTLAQTCITGLKDVLGIPLSIRHKDDGDLHVRIVSRIDAKEQQRVHDLFKVIEHGLLYVAESTADGQGPAVRVEHCHGGRLQQDLQQPSGGSALSTMKGEQDGS